MENLWKALQSPDLDPTTDDALDQREQEVLDAIAGSERSDPLTIRVTQHGAIPVIALDGELDVYTSKEFGRRMAEVLAGRPSAVIVDLSRAAYVDSSGLAVLLKAVRELAGKLGVVTAQPRIARLFQATGLERAMTVYPRLPDALSALQ